MAIRTASLLVALAAVALAGEAGAVDVGEEVEIGGEPLYVPAMGQQQHPAVAFDGENYLVVWTDDRVLSEPYAAYDIYGARVRASDGEVIDPIGFPISINPFSQEHPAAAFDGTNFLVVWEDWRSETTCADIYGARVSASDGALFDPDGIQISDGERCDLVPAIAFDGENYLVVWQVGFDGDDVGDGEVFGARVRASDGAVLDPEGIAISTAEQYKYDPRIAFSNGSYFVIWGDQRDFWTTGSDIYGARVNASDGAVLDPDGLPLVVNDEDIGMTALTTNGSDFLLVWTQWIDGVTDDLFGARVRGVDFTVIDGDGFPISTAGDWQYYPAAISDGTDYFVVWQDGRNENTASIIYGWDVYGARIEAADGGVEDPEGIPIYTSPSGDEAYQEKPQVAFGGGEALVVWEDDRRNGVFDIYGSRVDLAEGTVSEPGDFAISLTENTQGMPALAKGDDGKFLVAWYDGRYGESSGWDIFAALVSVEDGELAEVQEIEICTAASDQYAPEISYDGENYLVVWTDERDSYAVYGARIRAADGVVLDPDGYRISPAGTYAASPVVAFDGAQHLVAFEQWTNGGPDATSNIYGVRIRPSDGAVLDEAGIEISAAADDQFYSAIAYGEGEFLVLWSDYRNPIGDGYADLYAARVRGEDGAVLDPSGILVSAAAYGQGEAAAAFDGERFRIAWTDGRAGDNTDEYTIIMAPSGTLEPPLSYGEAVIVADNDQFLPDVAFDGMNWFIVWADQRSYETNHDDLYGARFSSAGEPIDKFAISDDYWRELSAELAFDDDGEALLVYERRAADGIRVVGRMLEDDLWEPSADTDTDTDSESDTGPNDAGAGDAGEGSGEGACGCSAIGGTVPPPASASLLEVVFRAL
jgi:large repetitive protein